MFMYLGCLLLVVIVYFGFCMVGRRVWVSEGHARCRISAIFLSFQAEREKRDGNMGNRGLGYHLPLLQYDGICRRP